MVYTSGCWKKSCTTYMKFYETWDILRYHLVPDFCTINSSMINLPKELTLWIEPRCLFTWQPTKQLMNSIFRGDLLVLGRVGLSSCSKKKVAWHEACFSETSPCLCFGFAFKDWPNAFGCWISNCHRARRARGCWFSHSVDVALDQGVYGWRCLFVCLYLWLVGLFGCSFSCFALPEPLVCVFFQTSRVNGWQWQVHPKCNMTISHGTFS